MTPNARRIFAISVAVVGVFAVGANADVIKITGVNSSTESVSIVGGPGDLGGPDGSGRVYTGLYTALNVTTGETWLTYCIDPIGEIRIGDSWDATYESGADLAAGEGVLYEPAYTTNPAIAADVTKQKYAMISYLAEKYYYNVNGSNALGASGRSELSLAFWEIARDYDGNVTSLNLAQGNFKSTTASSATALVLDAYNYRNRQITMAVWSPTERPSQEFLTIKVPEPSTFSLLLLGMSCMAGFWGIRRKK
jgi:hypothetical protein